LASTLLAMLIRVRRMSPRVGRCSHPPTIQNISSLCQREDRGSSRARLSAGAGPLSRPARRCLHPRQGSRARPYGASRRCPAKRRPGTWPGRNSTRTSTSLSGLKSSRRTDPNSANRAIWCRRQNADTVSRSDPEVWICRLAASGVYDDAIRVMPRPRVIQSGDVTTASARRFGGRLDPRSSQA